MDTISKIFLLMKNKGIEQKELAAYLGVGKAIITEWKGGRSHSYRKYIDKIAEYFGVSTDFLLNEDLLEIEAKKEPFQNVETVYKIYNTLLEIGYIQPGEEISDEKVNLLVEFLTANRRFLNQQLPEDK